MDRIAAWLAAGLIACSAALVLATTAGLPPVVASHFAADGRANGWMSREAYAWMMALLSLVTPYAVWGAAAWLPRRWPRLVNIPFRDYWLAPERREATLARLGRMGLWMGLLSAALIAGIHVEVVLANRRVPPAAGDGMFWVLGPFVVAIVALVVWTAWRFRLPKGARR